MMRYKFHLLIAFCSAFLASPVSAKDWIVDYPQSHLGFTGTQGSAAFSGSFQKFTVTIDFDPDKPETGKIAATIDMASANAGSDERNSALPQSDWFDTSKFPQAQFASTSIQKDACNTITPTTLTQVQCYKANGTLTIKGVTKPVVLSFLLAKEGDHMRAQGKAPLIRADFDVGKGQWADEAFVKHAVDVTMDIIARPAP